jgi:hypothetical protein
VFNFVKASFYQNDVLFDYSNARIYAYFGVMFGFIQGGM